MATVEQNAFELERRGYQWSMNNTLDDGSTSLLYDNDPNQASNTGTDGEKKLYSLLPGATYFQSNGNLWLKTNTPNTWEQLATQESLLTQDDSKISIDMSTTTTAPTTVDCFTVANNRAAKLVFSCYHESDYMTREILISYYKIKTGNVYVQGVSQTQYAILGNGELVDVDLTYNTGKIQLILTPSVTGIHVDIHKILV